MEIVSRPPSTSRVTSARSPAILSFEAKVACGQPSSAASICPVWFESSSIACLPRMIRPGFSFAHTALSSFATASGWSSSALSTRIARSAPMASAVRSVSWHAVTPQDTATISVAAPASLSRTASSTAISPKGFIDIFTFAVSTPLPSALTRTLTLKSTTRLTLTSIFIAKNYTFGECVERHGARLKHAHRIDVDRADSTLPLEHRLPEAHRHAREGADVAGRLAAHAAKERRDAKLVQARHDVGFAEGRQQQAEILERLEVDAAVAHHDDRAELRVEPRAEGELPSFRHPAGHDHAVEPRAQLAEPVPQAVEFAGRVMDVEGHEPSLALVRDV